MEQVICNESGIELIKRFEGLGDGDKATPGFDPYVCPAGIWTIGHGSIFGLDDRRVDASHRAINKFEAEWLLLRDIKRVEGQLARLVRVSVSENEWAAIVSLTFNIGSGNFQASTLRQRLNRRDKAGAADEFPKWRRGGGRILPGLVRRRAAERELFLEP